MPLLAALLPGAGGADTVRYQLEEGVLAVESGAQSVASGAQVVTLRFVPGSGVRLNAAAGIDVLAGTGSDSRSIATASGPRDRFYFTGPPVATFTAPPELTEVAARFAYCPDERSDCVIDEIGVKLPAVAR